MTFFFKKEVLYARNPVIKINTIAGKRSKENIIFAYSILSEVFNRMQECVLVFIIISGLKSIISRI